MENNMKILHSADWHIGNLKGPEKNGRNMRFEDAKAKMLARF